MMSSSTCCLLTLLLLIISSASAIATAPFSYISPLRIVSGSLKQQQQKHEVNLHTFFFNQTLDHFSFRPQNYTTFKQKFVINFKH
ncbi:hypothetical protein CDL15_Pgr025134 [Punica granatum]|uniref:Uncharacterized protein n=1 Tax=Punica granatum TaxID=22663 RepID=A0A218W7T9_PUNGR|nr:hypothetical protein CDL15_Pgr025134 [Punica granatum]